MVVGRRGQAPVVDHELVRIDLERAREVDRVERPHLPRRKPGRSTQQRVGEVHEHAGRKQALGLATRFGRRIRDPGGACNLDEGDATRRQELSVRNVALQRGALRLLDYKLDQSR